MPTLKGGARKKALRAKAIHVGEYIGGRFEGNAHHVKVVVQANRRSRVIPLVEKKFKSKSNAIIDGMVNQGATKNQATSVFKYNPALLNPRKQYKLMHEIAQLNRQKKLGIRLPTTIRLRTEPWYLFRKPSLILSFIPHIVSKRMLSSDQKRQFNEDAERQLGELRRNGFTAGEDAFEPQVNPKTKECVAYLIDFGTVQRYKPFAP